MDQSSAADKRDVSQVPSIQAEAEQLLSSINAQDRSNVVAPVITASTIGILNNTINITSPGCICKAPNNDTENSREALQLQSNKVAECQQKLKDTLKRKFSHLLDMVTTGAHRTPLNKIYTELYITEGGSAEVNKEHEVRKIEAVSRTHVAQDKSIHYNQLFVPLPGQAAHIRTVLTMGVAGIGKTVSANKFTLDWAEEEANHDLEFVFPLIFRELNLMREKKYSLEELLSVFFPETKHTKIFTSGNNKMLFILDGLDESRLSLNFHKNEIVSDVTEETTIAVLVTNLIRGKLLPLSLVWITSRPVASSQIPVECIDRVTEVRGFNNPQKDEYFRKKISDEILADRVIAHVKSCRSLHIMCHIPVFCWMAATVLEKRLATTGSKNTPRTLTEMYIQFLSLCVETMRKRLSGIDDSNTDSMRAEVISLGKLAFKELEEGNLIFYESDLNQIGINVKQASEFSGVYTQIFKEDLTLNQKMFCFVHLSVQEFFAALYVFLTFNNDNINVLVKQSCASRCFPFKRSSELKLHKAAVEKAVQCENGHFDIFLRFLLGLSLESNQTLLKHLMICNRTNQKTRTAIIKDIKKKIRSNLSPDRCLNLFHCLNELQDHSLVEEIQSFLRLGSLDKVKLSPAQWSTLVFVLLTSEEDLSVFELSKYARSEEGLLRLLPVVKTAQVVKLNACHLTVNCCEALANGISTSQIKELDLSNNNLTDSGIERLSGGGGLSSKLETLRLNACHLTVNCCEALADGISTSQIRELDLSNNNLTDSGVERLSGGGGLSSKLETLRLRSCNLTEEGCKVLASFISSESCQLKVLDLTDNDFHDDGVRTLCGGLKSTHCKLEILLLALCRVTEEGCKSLASVLSSSSLRELDLSYNHPGNLGLQRLSALRDDPQCNLQKLRVEECGESRIQPGPKKYIIKLILDPNTAHKDLSLSEGDTKATRGTAQPYSNHPERFDFWTQVLCSEALTGRHYWETEWCGKTVIGVAYKGMSRKGEGNECWLGRNDSSWGLNCTEDGYSAVHKAVNIPVTIPVTTQRSSRKVGVFLDWLAGTLSFYQESPGPLTPLHTFNTTFTEPVYPAFHLGWVDSTIQLC
ncbi:NLR family CARD domain-containing protein 3-like isoform X2 [Toxotes jaculatrix]|uniref:NLR family CARD domain-containing protein 3-like isoform X2 n=1 Tax=Toxotes jaculatrix TaxID=941984 RepID=UPI001B3AB20B|nr:NLR family CARD domain-containing protein 3-like isoform X2 [Toxotes jaculatrix]